MGWEKSPGQGGREEYKSVESRGHNRVAAETQQALNKCLVNDWRDEVKEIDQEPRTEGSGRLGREPHALSAHGFPTPPDAHPHQEHAMGIQMDPQLDAIDNLLSRPLGDPKVGDQGHDRNCKEPEGNELGW